MNHVKFCGTAAELRWSYHVAAALGPWEMTSGADGHTVTATVRSSDTFKVSQQPLTFVVTRPGGLTWCWPVTKVLQVTDRTLEAVLGPQE